jgi:hypothetical protein
MRRVSKQVAPPEKSKNSDKREVILVAFCRHLLLVGATLLVACTVAVPNVEMLASVDGFSAKSESPFEQDFPNKSVQFSGTCLPGVTGFEFRLNDHATWTAVAAGPPEPDSAKGEYKMPDAIYDLDCSDGLFNFYIFHSTIMKNFGGPNPESQDGDPKQVEIRPLGVEGIPTIIYKRPRASGFRFEPQGFDIWGHVQEGKVSEIRLRPVSSQGKQVDIPAGEKLQVTLSLSNQTSPNRSVGSLKKMATQSGGNPPGFCGTEVISGPIEIQSGEDLLEFCYDPAGTQPDDEIIISAESSGLATAEYKVRVNPQYSVVTGLKLISPVGFLPNTLIRGQEINLEVDLWMLVRDSGWVSQFSGGVLTVLDPSESVTFESLTSSAGCPTGGQVGSITCTNFNWTSKPRIKLKIPSTYSRDSLSLRLNLLKPATCATSCAVTSNGQQHAIGNVIAREFFFRVGGGSLTYDKPVMLLDPFQKNISKGRCTRGVIAAGNSEGIGFPFSPSASLTSLQLEVKSSSDLATFYNYYSACSGNVNGQTALTATLSESNPIQEVWFKVSAMPTNGILEVNLATVQSGTTTNPKAVQRYFIENDGGD